VDRLDLVYARANVSGPTSFEGMLDEWRFLPLTEVWSRRMQTSDTDILFFKAMGHQHRIDIQFRTFTPAEADEFSETLAEDFAAHRVKTDPAQIRDVLTPFVVE
jgi:hypothetical protein